MGGPHFLFAGQQWENKRGEADPQYRGQGKFWFGQLTPDEIILIDHSTNQITTQINPNNKVRVCVNIVAPYKKASDKPDQLRVHQR